MNLDVWIRYVILPALGTAALIALIVTLRQEWRDFIDGEW